MAGYVNNGTSRSLRVAIDQRLGGISVQGYPKIYDGQQSWGNPTYPTLTDLEARQLSDSEFGLRYNAFVEYVQSVEAGSDFSEDIVGDGPTKVDPTCLPTTTTTTTLADARIAVFIDFLDLGQIDPGDDSLCDGIELRHIGTSGVITGSISIVNTLTSGDGTWTFYTGGTCINTTGGSSSFTLSPGEAQYFSMKYTSVLSDADSNVTKVLSVLHNATNISSPKDTIITAHINPA